MKKKLLSYGAVVALFSFFSCKSGYLDPLTLGFRIETETQLLNAKSMKADEELTRTADVDVAQALKDKGVAIVDRVAAFYIDTVSVSFNKDVCEKLASYEITINYPTTPEEVVTVNKTTDDCSVLTRDPNSLLSVPVIIDKNSTNAQYKRILAVNWAPIFKAGKKITVSVKMKAAQGFDKVLGVNAFLTAHGNIGL